MKLEQLFVSLWTWASGFDWFPWKRKQAKPTGPEVKRYVVNDFLEWLWLIVAVLLLVGSLVALFLIKVPVLGGTPW